MHEQSTPGEQAQHRKESRRTVEAQTGTEESPVTLITIVLGPVPPRLASAAKIPGSEVGESSPGLGSVRRALRNPAVTGYQLPIRRETQTGRSLATGSPTYTSQPEGTGS